MDKEVRMVSEGWMIDALRKGLTWLGFTEEGIELFIALLFVREELLREDIYG